MHRSIRTAAVTAGLAAVGAALAAAPALAGGAVVTPEGSALVTPGTLVGLAGTQARAQVVATPSGRTVMTLHVSGLDEHRTYGAHAHEAPCALSGGAHFVGDPDAATVEEQEIWLDVRTNGSGSGTSTATRSWAISSDGRPASVIVHAEPTKADGKAGDKLGCIDITS